MPDPERCEDPTNRPCDACGAEAGEECRPMCIGQAQLEDELRGEDRAAC